VGFALGALVAAASVLGVLAARSRLLRHESTPTIVSGRASPRKTQSGRDERWVERSVTITLDPSLNAIDRNAREAVEHAFDAWTGSAGLPALSFDVVSDSEAVSSERDGVNRVVYAPIDVRGHRDDLALTLSYIDASTGEILEADIIVNSRQRFTLVESKTDPSDARPSCVGAAQPSACGGFDLQNVVTHEVGHFFGLGEDRDDRFNTMFECTSRCETHKRDLATDDSAAIVSLYANAETTEAVRGCALSSGRSPHGLTSIGGASLLLLGLLLRRRRASAVGSLPQQSRG
jgi:hypothetical protein